MSKEDDELIANAIRSIRNLSRRRNLQKLFPEEEIEVETPKEAPAPKPKKRNKPSALALLAKTGGPSDPAE